MIKMTSMPQNYRKQVDWVFGAYENAGVTLPEGFQKDAIQNAVGARKYDKWDGWWCDIYLVSNDTGTFLVVEDSGTVGLMGDNLSMEEIKACANREENLPPEQRLARFSSMNNSGGNKTGGGLYGVGKVVYSVSSARYCYYFDSLREDGKYVANINDAGEINEYAFEDEEAKKFIFEKTGLVEKTTIGTRIIIVDPKQEIIESINSGEMALFIQESWWLIIQRLGKGSKIMLNHKEVPVPTDIIPKKHYFDMRTPTQYKPGYRVKKLGIYLFEDGSNRWNGISYYRKGMKIGSLDMDDIPEQVRGKFWGYVEVDESWEEELAEIEDTVHFGVKAHKKRTNTYQYLKNFCAAQFKELLIEWGYIKDVEHQSKKLKEELDKIAEDLQDIFDEVGFEDLGKGPRKPDFDVRWNHVIFPMKGTEEVSTGEEIKFSVRISSSYMVKKTFEYTLTVVDPATSRIISKIDSQKIAIEAGKVYEVPYVFKISPDVAFRYAENRVVLKVKVSGSSKERIKDLRFFYDVIQPVNSRNRVILSLHSCDFPTLESRRINFGEQLRKISYRVDNQQNKELNYRLNVSVHNAEDPTLPKITDIASIEKTVGAYEEDIVFIPDILFDEETYSDYLTEGRLQLRARLIAAADNDIFEKGEKITTYSYDLFLNADEKNGKRHSFEPRSMNRPEDYRRAWYDVIGTRAIVINVGHRAYTRLADNPEMQHHYMFEQMLRQYVMIYLAEGQFSMFKAGDEEFLALDPVKAAEKVIDKVEEIYFASINR